MSLHTFEIISNATPSKKVSFKATTGVYQDAILEAVEAGVIETGKMLTGIKIWCEHLVPAYGPYFYSLINIGNKFLINDGSEESFEKAEDFIADGEFLGYYRSQDKYADTPFYGFENEQWIKFFKITPNYELNFRQYSRSEIVQILKDGGSISVDIKRSFNRPARYAFQVVNNNSY